MYTPFVATTQLAADIICHTNDQYYVIDCLSSFLLLDIHISSFYYSYPLANVDFCAISANL